MYLPSSDQSVSVFANLKIVGNTLNAVLASLEATAKEEMTSKDFEGGNRVWSEKSRPTFI